MSKLNAAGTLKLGHRHVKRLGYGAMQLAGPPGTSSVAHLRENLAAAALELPDEVMAALDGVGASADGA
ncbi:hypothetical protein WME76_35070 [Sorangium sp. So ce119]